MGSTLSSYAYYFGSTTIPAGTEHETTSVAAAHRDGTDHAGDTEPVAADVGTEAASTEDPVSSGESDASSDHVD